MTDPSASTGGSEVSDNTFSGPAAAQSGNNNTQINHYAAPPTSPRRAGQGPRIAVTITAALVLIAAIAVTVFKLAASSDGHPRTGQSSKTSTTGAITGPGTVDMCVDVDTNTSASGNPVQLWKCDPDTKGQQWTMESDGTVRAFGKCLDIEHNGTANQARVQLWDCTEGVGGQRWIHTSNGELWNPQSGRCLAPHGAAGEGTLLQIYDCNRQSTQRWTTPAVGSSTS
jgi:Ricin-type beta-trefoil lectin domain